MRVAGIDCGTNTIRLLISEVIPEKKNSLGKPILRDLVRMMEVVRLGAGVDETANFNPAALQRTLNVVAQYAHLCREYQVESIRFAATSATRDAQNRDLFIDGVHSLLGISPQVISGKQEASTSFTGAICALDQGEAAKLKLASPIIAVDLGGGSTELALGTLDGEIISSYSMDIGSVRMHERHLGKGKASPQAVQAAREDIRGFLDRAETYVDLAAPQTLIGLAGTVTSIGAKWLNLNEYDSEKIHGLRMSIAEVKETCQWFIESDLSQRLALGYMHPGRADVINAGALVWQEVVNRIAQRTAQAAKPIREVIISEHDILDGLALWAAVDIQQPKFA